MPATESNADFRFVAQGSVCLIEALSEPAREFAEENLHVEGWMGRPTRFQTDYRVGYHLTIRLMEEGFDIEGVI